MKKFEDIIEFYNSLRIGDIGVIYYKENNEDAITERIIIFKITIGKGYNFYGQSNEIFIREYKKYDSKYFSTSCDKNSPIIWIDEDNGYELTYGHEKEKEKAEFFILNNNEETTKFFHQTSGRMGFFDQQENQHKFTADYIKDKIGKLRI